MNNNCEFCNFDDHVLSERRIFDYEYWRLILQLPEKLASTKQSAGLLVCNRHVSELSDLTAEEATELMQIIKDASKRLCVAVSTTYLGQETIGFNQGKLAGQTIFHAHVHVLPVAQEDPDEMKGRSGIGAAFEALRKERIKR